MPNTNITTQNNTRSGLVSDIKNSFCKDGNNMTRPAAAILPQTAGHTQTREVKHVRVSEKNGRVNALPAHDTPGGRQC